MESLAVSRFDRVGSTVRKKRSNTSRRPRPDSLPFPDSRDLSPSSSTPASDNASKVSSDENAGYDTSPRRKEFNLNQYTLGFSSVSRTESEIAPRKVRKVEGGVREFNEFHKNDNSRSTTEQGRKGPDFKRCSEGVFAPANWKNTIKVKESYGLQTKKMDSHMGISKSGESRILDGSGNENKLKKVKLKVGGVTRTIHAKSTTDAASGGRSSSDFPRPRQKLIISDDSDDDQSPQEMASGLQGIPWKDFSKGGFSIVKKEGSLRGKMSDEVVSAKRTDKSEAVRKSKRVPKRRVLDGAFDDEDDDNEIRYLERLKTSKGSTDYVVENGKHEEGSKSQRKISRDSKSRAFYGNYDEDLEYGLSRSGKDGKKKFTSEKPSEDADYVEDEDAASDGEPEAKRKKQRKDFVDTLMEGKKETTLTTRQRALQSSKDIPSGPGANLIEFPNGLPPLPPRKQKDKLSEVEQQLKKAEAAQRRRMQVEKAARESEAEAIRKILGQDSSRKKREDKLKKRRDELAQEKAANALTLAPNTVRWVMGPNGTTVTFSNDIGLPSIFDPKPCSYPPPREKCAGPFCTNPYKYRDSKSNLPLCSLQCYKAIREKMEPPTSSWC